MRKTFGGLSGRHGARSHETREKNGYLVEPIGDATGLAAAIRSFAEMSTEELEARWKKTVVDAERLFSGVGFTLRIGEAIAST